MSTHESDSPELGREGNADDLNGETNADLEDDSDSIDTDEASREADPDANEATREADPDANEATREADSDADEAPREADSDADEAPREAATNTGLWGHWWGPLSPADRDAIWNTARSHKITPQALAKRIQATRGMTRPDGRPLSLLRFEVDTSWQDITPSGGGDDDVKEDPNDPQSFRQAIRVSSVIDRTLKVPDPRSDDDRARLFDDKDWDRLDREDRGFYVDSTTVFSTRHRLEDWGFYNDKSGLLALMPDSLAHHFVETLKERYASRGGTFLAGTRDFVAQVATEACYEWADMVLGEHGEPVVPADWAMTRRDEPHVFGNEAATQDWVAVRQVSVTLQPSKAALEALRPRDWY